MYQKHSETSREAYRTLEGSRDQRERIFRLIDSHGCVGISAPNIASALEMVPGTVAARVIELERDGRIVKLERTEKSPSRRNSNVIIAARLRSEALARGERILSTKPENKETEALDIVSRGVLEDIETMVALGAPILYGSELHNRIKTLLKK